jgi:carbon monoxide dehydrogenase subunit G
MVATVEIDIPTVIYAEAAPNYRFGYLPTQRNKVTPATSRGNLRVEHEAEVSTRRNATRVARVLHAQYGCVYAQVSVGVITNL